jgi:hypothetical protein
MLLTDVGFGEAEARQVYSVIMWRTHHAPDSQRGCRGPMPCSRKGSAWLELPSAEGSGANQPAAMNRLAAAGQR